MSLAARRFSAIGSIAAIACIMSVLTTDAARAASSASTPQRVENLALGATQPRIWRMPQLTGAKYMDQRLMLHEGHPSILIANADGIERYALDRDGRPQIDRLVARRRANEPIADGAPVSDS